MNKTNYLAFPILDLALLLLARLSSALTRKLNHALRRGSEMDSFVRHANLRGCELQRQGPFVVVKAPEAVLGATHSMKLRIKSTDFAVYSSGVFGHDYRPLDDLVRTNGDSIRFVVDAGANIGSISLLFSVKFPGADICSVEADSSNFQMLLANMELNGCNKVSCHHAALWGRREKLAVTQEHGHWGRRVVAGGEGLGEAESVPSVTMGDILASAPQGRIDILKMDIEGAEANVFSDRDAESLSWLDKVRFLAIEIHGERLETEIKSTLKKRGFFVFQTGETTYAENRNFVLR